MEEMKEAVEREANESVEQLEKQKRKKSEEDQHQLKEIEELERQAEEAEERSRTLRDEARRKSEAADKKLQDFATELEEQRKREHEERVDRATRSVSEEVEPEFLASVIDEMAGLTSEISEELDKTGSTASVTDGVEVAMAVPEVAVVAPEESLESAPVTNGDGKSEEPSLEEQPMESNKDPSDVLGSSEVDVNVTPQLSAKQGEVPVGKATKRGVDNRPLGSIKDRMAAFQGNGSGVGVSSAAGAKSSERSRAVSEPVKWTRELQKKKQLQSSSVTASKEKEVLPTTPTIATKGEDGGMGVVQHCQDQLSAAEGSIADNPYIAAVLANMPTGLPQQPEVCHFSADVLHSQRSHKLHKEMELIEKSIRQARLDNSRAGKGENPYLESVLQGMPPVVSADEVELGNHGDERRRRWREQKQSELNCSVRQTQEAIDRARTAQQ